MENLWIKALSVGGIGAVGAFVLYSLYKEWLKVPWLKDLTPRHQYRLMRLFLFLTFCSFGISVIAYIIAPEKPTKNHNITVDINNGTININYNQLNDQDKIYTLPKLTVEDIITFADVKFYEEKYKEARVLYRSALNIDQRNQSTIQKLSESMIKLIKTEADRNSLFEDFINQGHYFSQATPQFPNWNSETYKEDLTTQSIYYDFAKRLYPIGHPNHSKAVALSTQVAAAIGRNAGNDIADVRIDAILREKADNSYSKGDYIQALYNYSILYNSSSPKPLYPLEKINYCLERLRQLSGRGGASQLPLPVG